MKIACRSCGAPVLWVQDMNSVWVQLDAQPKRTGLRFPVVFGKTERMVGRRPVSRWLRRGYRLHIETKKKVNDG